MSDESSGAGQGALPPREGLTSRSVVERPAVRPTQVAGGQYLLTSQPHGMPALAQISSANVSTSNSSAVTSPSRPSTANQNIVNALTKPRPAGNVRLQLFPTVETSTVQALAPVVRSPVKRALPPSEERDSYSVKLQRLMNHRNVRLKIVKEKYNEHLMEKYYLETAGNILDLPQFAKRPKTQHYIAHLKENPIDPRETIDEDESS